ncbi:ribokinase [Endozoicomonas ascidiicola]|uniref:ribokinase n=1 Tax=Endozoicomonas ascidiicola TaxID=1698521 RepID=UPI000830FBB2|nr:ribokinase [Endozoicomonas ascidiicola]
MIAVIGSNMVDLITYTDIMPKAGETLEAGRFAMGCGGKGANQAVAAAKLGAKVTMVSKVGDDAFADNTIANFQSFGIDTQHVRKEPGFSSGVAPIFVDSNSQNRILIIKGANSCLSPKDIDDAAEDLKKCGLIVLQLEVPLETVYYAIDFGNQNNIPVLLNPAPASKELDIDYACRCDFFVPNETELEILTGLPVKTEEEIVLAAESLLNKGLKNIIVTMGSRGVLWMSENQKELIGAYTVDAVDTSGAGDAFIGCFAAHYVQCGDVSSSLHEANAYAACSVTACGTQSSYPDAARFTEMRKQFDQ